MLSHQKVLIALFAIIIPLLTMGDDLDIYGQTNEVVVVDPITVGSTQVQAIQGFTPIQMNQNMATTKELMPNQAISMPNHQTIQALAMANGISINVIESVFEIAYGKGIPVSITETAILNVISNNLDIAIATDIAEIAFSNKVDVSVIAQICALAYTKELSEGILVDIAKLSESNKIGLETVKAILELDFVSKSIQSRFDMMNPTTFSNLWMIKMKGKDMEARGENTDELWKQYWEMFDKAARQGL